MRLISVATLFGNEPIGTALLWPPVLLFLITALRTSGRASLASRAQRALCTNQGSRPIVTTCAANHGPSHVVFSLGGSAMLSPLSPSCRLAERPLNTYRLSNVSITTAVRSQLISLPINGLYKLVSEIIPLLYLGSFFFVIVYAKLAILNHILLFVINQLAWLSLISRFPAFSHPTHSTKNQIRKPGSKQRRLHTVLIF